MSDAEQRAERAAREIAEVLLEKYDELHANPHGINLDTLLAARRNDIARFAAAIILKHQPEPNLSAAIAAAEGMDWQQVVLNGGPPCFHLQANGRFCGRAQRWMGHDGDPHDFVSLADLLRAALPAAPRPAAPPKEEK